MATEELTTARLHLVPLTAGDAEDLFPVFDDPALGRWTGETPPADVETLRRRFAAWEAGPGEDGAERWLNWAMRRREGMRVGCTRNSTVVGQTAAVAWVVGTAFQGQGFATEAARALVAWLRDSGIAEIEASIHPGNVPSQVVASRAGMRPSDRLDDGEVVWTVESGTLPSAGATLPR
jgi:RimJ/RimL family protein N-acetyltransferase